MRACMRTGPHYVGVKPEAVAFGETIGSITVAATSGHARGATASPFAFLDVGELCRTAGVDQLRPQRRE